MEIRMVVAVSRTGCIGDDGRVPWEYPHDVDQYKRRVRGDPVVVGRRTFDVMDPIDDSLNIVVTRDEHRTSEHERVEYVTSRREAVERAERAGGDAFSVIGGAGIYQQFAAFADRAFVSEIPETLDGDAYFPYLGAGWNVVSRTAFDRFELVEYENSSPAPREQL